MKTDIPDEELNRQPNGQFKTGTSGNPTGRPKTESSALRAQLAEKGAEVANKVLEAALDGDMQACRMVMDRISPTLKAQAAPVLLDMPQPQSISETAQAFIKAASDGELSPDIAAQLVAAVGTLARIIEVDELKDRLESLERIMKEKTK